MQQQQMSVSTIGVQLSVLLIFSLVWYKAYTECNERERPYSRISVHLWRISEEQVVHTNTC